MNDVLEHLKVEFPHVYFQNSFFYTKLLENGVYNYWNVGRWTRNVDIFSKAKMMFPIHIVSIQHWCLGVVDFQRHKIGYYDSLPGEDGNPHAANEFVINMKMFLKDVYLSSRGESLDTSTWTVDSSTAPMQENEYDCGAFVLMCAEYLSQDRPLTFSQADIPGFRSRMSSML